jgi:hypothetical protein
MSKQTAIAWVIEFGAITAIAVILSTATTREKWWVILPGGIVLATKIVEYLYNRKVYIEIVRYQLQVLVTLLPNDGSKVRCTYHRPIQLKFRDRTLLEQAFDYIPQGGGAGRSFPIEKGIIGKAYSTKAPRVENFSSDREYRERMVNEYNYTIAEVMERTADRRSYICYPVLEEKHNVLGLIYLDSDRPNTFTIDANNPRWQAIRDAGEVIRGNILAST